MNKKVLGSAILVLIIIGGIAGYYLWRKGSGYDYVYEESAGIEKFTLQYKQIEGVDENLLSLDIYSHPDFSDNPIMIYVHGGGLKNGDKTNDAAYKAKSHFFISSGYVYISVNYRLSPEVISPSHIEDFADAFMFIYNNIALYGGNKSQIYIMGHSAGAYLVSLLGTNEKYIQDAGGTLSLIKGVISLDTWTYMSVQEWQEQELSKDELERFEAVPSNHVTNGKGIPPFLIFYRDGRSDAAIQADQLAFVKLLQENYLDAAAILCKNNDHNEVTQQVGTIGDEKTEIIIKFLGNPANVSYIAESYGFITYEQNPGNESIFSKKGLYYLIPSIIIIIGLGISVCRHKLHRTIG